MPKGSLRYTISDPAAPEAGVLGERLSVLRRHAGLSHAIKRIAKP